MLKQINRKIVQDEIADCLLDIQHQYVSVKSVRIMERDTDGKPVHCGDGFVSKRVFVDELVDKNENECGSNIDEREFGGLRG